MSSTGMNDTLAELPHAPGGSRLQERGPHGPGAGDGNYVGLLLARELEVHAPTDLFREAGRGGAQGRENPRWAGDMLVVTLRDEEVVGGQAHPGPPRVAPVDQRLVRHPSRVHGFVGVHEPDKADPVAPYESDLLAALEQPECRFTDFAPCSHVRLHGPG